MCSDLVASWHKWVSRLLCLFASFLPCFLPSFLHTCIRSIYFVRFICYFIHSLKSIFRSCVRSFVHSLVSSFTHSFKLPAMPSTFSIVLVYYPIKPPLHRTLQFKATLLMEWTVTSSAQSLNAGGWQGLKVELPPDEFRVMSLGRWVRSWQPAIAAQSRPADWTCIPDGHELRDGREVRGRCSLRLCSPSVLWSPSVSIVLQ